MSGRLVFRTMAAALVAVFALQMAVADHGNDDDDQRFRIKAKLFGDMVVRGSVDYRERTRDEGLERRFKVQVRNAQPGEQFDVSIGDYFVGTVTANDLGRGKLQLRTPQFIDDPGDGEPMPSDFPFLNSLESVQVGSLDTATGLSGIFFDRDDDMESHAQRYRLEGDFNGGDGLDGDVKYREKFKNGQLQRRFKVEVEDAQLGQIFEIRVNGQLVGEIEITDSAETEFQLRTAAFIDDPGDGEPMPADFPTLMPGDVVTVGPLTTTMLLD